MVSRYICKNLLKYENHRKNLIMYKERKCHKPLFQFKSFYTLSISLLSFYLDPQSSICYCSFWRRQFQRERGAPDSNPPFLHCNHKHMLEYQMNTHYTSIFRNQISTHGRGEVGGVDLTGLPLLPCSPPFHLWKLYLLEHRPRHPRQNFKTSRIALSFGHWNWCFFRNSLFKRLHIWKA